MMEVSEGVDYATVISKQCLYRWQCLKLNINVHDAIREILFVKNLEEKEAICQQKTRKYNKRWNENLEINQSIQEIHAKP